MYMGRQTVDAAALQPGSPCHQQRDRSHRGLVGWAHSLV